MKFQIRVRIVPKYSMSLAVCYILLYLVIPSHIAACVGSIKLARLSGAELTIMCCGSRPYRFRVHSQSFTNSPWCTSIVFPGTDYILLLRVVSDTWVQLLQNMACSSPYSSEPVPAWVNLRTLISWLSQQEAPYTHHVINTCVPIFYYSENTRCVCILEDLHGSV